MAASSLVDFFLGLKLSQTESESRRRTLLSLSLVANLGLLGFFKYFNFFADSLQSAAEVVGIQLSPSTLNIILPVGISFYTFQTLSYTIDIYRRTLTPTRSLLDYLTFVSFFPQLVAGPIERASHLLPQFLSPRQFNEAAARDGLRQMLAGFFKKMVLADNLALIVDPVYATPDKQPGPTLMLATVCFAFQIYYDFSGYSDIAIGTANLFGVRLMRNFAYPYFSQSVAEFWRRWHISLSTWFRDYVYIPLGGSRASAIGRVRNILITFITSGFWHGAAWTFGIWGGLNGVMILPETFAARSRRTVSQIPGGECLLPRPAVLGRMVVTFAAICVTWIFFRATSLGDALLILRKIVTEVTLVSRYQPLLDFLSAKPEHLQTLVILVGFVGIEWMRRNHDHVLAKLTLGRGARWAIYTGAVWAIATFGTRTSGSFIYFQF